MRGRLELITSSDLGSDAAIPARGTVRTHVATTARRGRHLVKYQRRSLARVACLSALRDDAIGSVAECETQLEIASRLKYASGAELSDCAGLGGDLRRVLFGLRRSLRRTSSKPTP